MTTSSTFASRLRWLDRQLDRRRVVVVALFFTGLVGLGVAVYDDYGVGWDEGNNTVFGSIMLDHVSGKNPNARHYQDSFWHPVTGQFARTHGPVVEMFLVWLAGVVGVENSREQFLLRHISIYLIFCVGVLFCYLLCARIMSSWRLGLVGAVLMVLSPRIFAHAFHNSMDIAFLAAFTASMYTLVCFLERNTPLTAALHGVACAVMVDIRIAGLVMPVFTAAFLFMEVLLARSRRRMFGRCAITYLDYLLVFCPLAVLGWPMLWSDPIGNLLISFEVSANDPWEWWELYFGEKVHGTGVPWHFTPVWMAITLPPAYLALFLVGLARLVSAVRWSRRFYREHRGVLVALCCLTGPLTAVGVLGSTLFNGWRHMYFVYPGFILVALLGLRALTSRGWLLRSHRAVAWSRAAVAVVLLISAVSTARFMVHSHPHQLSYFNLLTGGLSGAKERFQFGYWGAEYREGLEWLLRKAPQEHLSIYMSDTPVALFPVKFNAMILPDIMRGRVGFADETHHAEYFITNHCNHVPRYKFQKLWARKVEGVEILTVYRVHPNIHGQPPPNK